MPSQTHDNDFNSEKRQTIIDVARKHFMSHGFFDTGMAQIARDAEVSTATLYKAARSKEQLFTLVVEDAFSGLRNQIFAVETPKSGDLYSRLRTLLRHHIEVMIDNEYHILFARVLAVTPRFAQLGAYVYEQQFEALYEKLGNQLNELIENDLLVPHDTHTGSRILAATIREQFQFEHFLGDSLGGLDRGKEHLLDLTLYAYCARNGRNWDQQTVPLSEGTESGFQSTFQGRNKDERSAANTSRD